MKKTILYSIFPVSIFLTNLALATDVYERFNQTGPTGTTAPVFFYATGPTGMSPLFDLQSLQERGLTGSTGAVGLTGGFMVQVAPSDPAIRHYNPSVLKMTGDTLNQLISRGEDLSLSLYRVNSLELTGCEAKTLVLLRTADLSTIRHLVLGSIAAGDVDSFFKELCQNNPTLRSLTKVDATGTNLTPGALKVLRDEASFSAPLIRDMWQMGGCSRMYVAGIQVVVEPTFFASIDEKRALTIPSSRNFDVLYRSERYSPGSAAHLQLQFD